jgi:hypothetical protein
MRIVSFSRPAFPLFSGQYLVFRALSFLVLATTGHLAAAQDPTVVPKTETSAASANVLYALNDTDEGVDVVRQNQLVARYLRFSGAKPVIFPLLGPGGEDLTRHYPIADPLDSEKRDHIHHRSFWFTHGDVNGVDFWAETANHGRIEQQAIETSSTGETVTITTENAWVNADGKRLLSDRRDYTFFDFDGMRAIDCVIELRATDGDVVFGDTKEGSFGIRVAGTMKVDAGKGGKIISSRGLEDGKTWAQQAEWVDYYGPVKSPSTDGESIAGVAIMNHPTSFGFPTRWHVRTYGLFAANPFGVHHFVGGAPTEGVTIEAGETLTLKYRVLLHSGSTEDADIAPAWKAYAGE